MHILRLESCWIYQRDLLIALSPCLVATSSPCMKVLTLVSSVTVSTQSAFCQEPMLNQGSRSSSNSSSLPSLPWSLLRLLGWWRLFFKNINMQSSKIFSHNKSFSASQVSSPYTAQPLPLSFGRSWDWCFFYILCKLGTLLRYFICYFI